ADFDDFARHHLPAARGINEHELRSGAGAMLSAIVTDMRAEKPADDQRARSRGQRPDHAPHVTMTARQHAEHRLKAGFSLKDLVAEYRALRSSVTLGWMAHSSTPKQTVEELVRFNNAMDQSLGEAINWFYDETDRARDLFVGVLGHDLRDPLNSAVSANELQRISPEQGVRKRANAAVDRNLNRIGGMIGYLLDFARTRLGGQLPINPTPVDMAQLCHEVTQSVGLTSPAREVRVECSGELSGHWDALRIKQAVTNLLRNAISYGEEREVITLTVDARADDITISVHNVGAPIPSEQIPTLFDPLTRGTFEPKSGRAPDDSLGLGLYIVSEVAEAHGGDVSVDSSAAEGTTFTLRLPKQSPRR
ncbi:MAG: sensor histidine kinase, partial [Gammaproteobacteria bacterium]